MPQSSKVDSETDTLTRAPRQGVVLGTVQYMSPEQASNRYSIADARDRLAHPVRDAEKGLRVELTRRAKRLLRQD